MLFMFAKIIPHVANFIGRLTTEIAVACEDHRLLIAGEEIELKGGLNEECNRAMEEIRPNLLLKGIGEFLSNNFSKTS